MRIARGPKLATVLASASLSMLVPLVTPVMTPAAAAAKTAVTPVAPGQRIPQENPLSSTSSTDVKAPQQPVAVNAINPAVLTDSNNSVSISLRLNLRDPILATAASRQSTQLLIQMSPVSTIHRQTLVDWVHGQADLSLGELIPISTQPLQKVLPETQVEQLVNEANAAGQTSANTPLWADITLTVPRRALPLNNPYEWGPRGVEVNLVNTNSSSSQKARSVINIAPTKSLEVQPTPLVVIAPITARPTPVTGFTNTDTNSSTAPSTAALALAQWPLPSLSKMPSATTSTQAPADAKANTAAAANPANSSRDNAQKWPELRFGKGWAVWFDPALVAANSLAIRNYSSADLGTPALDENALIALNKWYAAKTDLLSGVWAFPNEQLLNSPNLKSVSTLSTTLTEGILTELNRKTQLTDPHFAVRLHNTAAINTQEIQILSDSQFPLPDTATYHPGALTTTDAVIAVDAQGNAQGPISSPSLRAAIAQAGSSNAATANQPLPPTREQQRLILADSGIEQQLAQAANSPEEKFLHLQLARAFLAMKTRERPQDPRSTVVALPSLTATPESYSFGEQLLADPWVRTTNLAAMRLEEPDTVERFYYLSAPQRVGISNPQASTQTAANSELSRAKASPVFTSSGNRALAAGAAQSNLRSAALAQELSQKHDRLGPVLRRNALWTLSTSNTDASLHHLANIANTDSTMLRQAVSLSVISTANIISRDSHLPVNVRNNLAQPVQVHLAVDPSDSRVQIPTEVVLTVPGNSSQNAKIPIKAIGNGSVALEIEATDRNGTIVSKLVSTRLSINAGLENVGLQVLGIVLGVVFIVSLAVNVLKSKRFHHFRKRLQHNSK